MKKNETEIKTDFAHTSIDEFLSSRIRLSVMAVLLGCESADFTFLRESVQTTDGNLTAHCQKLEEVGYLTIEKRFVGKKPQTLFRITERGRQALSDYAKKLGQMLGIS